MLRGEKVILRAVTREDLPRFCDFANDVEFSDLEGDFPWKPASLARMQAQFDEDLKRELPSNRVFFVIEADGRPIGGVSLRDIDQTAGKAELGIGIGDHDYWGRGFGRDAVRTILRYAFDVHNLHRVWLRTGADNERAIRCYRACGFVQEGVLRQHDWSYGRRCDVVCMGILRAEWVHSREPSP